MAEQVEDRVEGGGDEVAEPVVDGASMWPVMSNRPGEGWLPPLTAPPGATEVVVVLGGADLDGRPVERSSPT